MHRFYKLHLFLFIYRESIDLHLYRACRDGDQTVIASLLERGADPSKLFSDPLTSSPPSDAYSYTPVHIACHNGHLNCLKLLVKAKTRYLKILDSNHQTLLHIACEKGHKQIVHYVLTHTECNVIVQDVRGNTPLHIASQNGHLECVKLIIETDTVRVDPNLTNKDMKTALHLASENGHTSVTEYLLTCANCNPNIQDFYGSTPLHVASRNGHLDCVKLIVEQSTVRVDPDLTNKSAETALFIACENGHKDVAEYLLTHAECNQSVKNEVGNTMVHVASRNGHLKIVKFIIETNTVSIDPDELNDCDQTALHLACRNGHGLIIEYLLTRAKCNPNLKDINGNTPLHVASGNGYLECVKSIIKTSSVSVDRNSKNINEQTALHLACGHADVTEYLLTCVKCNPSIQDSVGNTPLHVASYNGFLECVKLIIETSTVRINPNLTNINKQTAVHLATKNGHRNVVSYLLSQAKCNPNIKDCDGNALLHIAGGNGELEFVKLIVEESTVHVDPNVSNQNKQTALHMACINGYMNLVEYLMAHTNCNPYLKDNDGNTALHIVCNSGNLEIARSIRIKCDATNDYKQTGLHLACNKGHEHIVHWLLTDTKCNPNLKDKDGNTPLHIASHEGHFECVKLIIVTGAGVVDPDVYNNHNETALRLACRNGHRNTIKYLLTHGKCNPNLRDIDGNTPLHLACFVGDLEIVKLTIDSVDPDVTNNDERTCLHMAYRNGHKTTVKWLLNHGKCNPNLRDKDGNTPLHFACYVGDLDIVKLIIDSVDPDVTNNKKRTGLHLACRKGHKTTVKWLLIHVKCNPNLRDIDGNTPLHFACYVGDLDIVKLIIDSVDPDVTDVTNNKKRTGLHLACRKGHKTTFKWLLTHVKCNPNLRDIDGNTPLHLACYVGDLEIVKLIIETSTADPNVTNKHCETPLHLAYVKCHESIAEYLLTVAKCNPCLRDGNGITALHNATLNGYLECVKLIVEASTNEIAYCIACENTHGDENGWRKTIEYLLTHTNCNPNYCQDGDGNTVLHLASRNGRLNIMQLIIDFSKASIDLNLANRSNQTPLHLAYANGHIYIAKYLLSHADCNPNITLDEYKNTPLHVASQNGDLQIVKFIFETSIVRVNPDETNILGQTALHFACTGSHKVIVEYLLSRAKCNPCLRDGDGNTPLHIATHNGDMECVKLIFETSTITVNSDVSNVDDKTALHIACTDGHTDIVEWLLAHTKCNPNVGGYLGNTPLHIACRFGDLEMVKLIIETSKCSINPDVSNYDNQTALHVACKNDCKEIVGYLLTHTKCNINVEDSNGDTPLHIACRIDSLDCVEIIVSMNPNTFLQTALHLACKHSKTNIVEFFLTNTRCDPNLKDQQGRTPLFYAEGNPEIVRHLIRHGADPKKVYKANVLGKLAKQPPKSRTKIIIIGDKKAGKTTLVEALKKEKSFFMKVFTTTDVITEVETNTAGIIPHEFESRHYGKVTFYDLAGHREYYGSHSAVLKSLTGAKLPTALLVTDLSKGEDGIEQSLTYWVNFLENQFSAHQNQTCKLPVVVVGSHLDLVSYSDINEKKNLVAQIINSSASIEFIAFVPMNCQLCESLGMDKLHETLKEYSQELQSEEVVKFNAHCFYIYLVDKCQDLKAVSLGNIKALILQDRTRAVDLQVSSFLPESLERLCKICEDLNNRGIVLFLKDAINLPDSWVVMDKSGILSEINGTVFASANLRQFKHLSSSTGVVPVSKLEETFPHYDMKMLVGVLQYFEFCHYVCDQLITLIHKQNERDSACMEQADAPTFKKEHYLFFPSLVRVEAPNDLWKPNPQYQVHFGWIIQCTQPQKSFLPRFQSVLCNRLAFKFALAPDPKQIDPTIPALQRKCSVWKNGIYWGTRQPLETLVEVDTHCKSVVLLMRCRATSADLRKLRFEVIQTILKCAEEFCPRIKTAISLIPRKDISYPLKPVAELTSISLPEVITAVSENSDSAVSKDGKPTPLEDLIGTGRKIEVSWLLRYTVYNYIRILMSPMIVYL